MILDNMSKECMRLTTSCAILGVGVDGGGIRPADRKEAVVAEMKLLSGLYMKSI